MPPVAAHAVTNSGSGTCGKYGCRAAAEQQTTQTAKPANGSSPPPCEWTVAPDTPGITPLDSNGDPVAPDDTGRWYQVRCPASDPNFGPGAIPITSGDVPTYLLYVRTGDTTALRQQALSNLSFQVPQLRFNPANLSIVNSPTYLWLDGLATQSATAMVGPVSVSVSAVPQSVTWTMGDGNAVTCNGPGVVFDAANPNKPGTCSYSYKRSSAGQPNESFTVTATVEWATTWTATGVAGGGALGTYTSSNVAQMRVGEIQAVNVYPGVSK